MIPEDWGGDTQFIEVSAITGQGVENLLEANLLQAEAGTESLHRRRARAWSSSQGSTKDGVRLPLCWQNGTLKPEISC